MTHGAPSTPPISKPIILTSEDNLLDPSVLSTKYPTDSISDHPDIISTIDIRRDYSMLPTVQLNLAPSHITSSVTIFETSNITISAP